MKSDSSEIQKRMEKVAGKLLDQMPDVRYAVLAEAGVTSQKLAKKTVDRLLLDQGKLYCGMELLHDSSGAPFIQVYDEMAVRWEKPLFISLTDEDGMCVCIALLSEESGREKGKNLILKNRQMEDFHVLSESCACELVGVGIDLADGTDMKCLRHVSNSRFARYFSRDEQEQFQRLPEKKAGIYLAGQFSKREAAFKSMSAVYRKYREANKDRALPVSMMDFSFPRKGKTLLRGMTADIYRIEKLNITHCSVHYKNLVGTIAVCYRERRDYEIPECFS